LIVSVELARVQVIQPRKLFQPSIKLSKAAGTTRANMSPPVLEFIVEEYLQSKRIETFLVRHLRNYTTYRIQRMIKAGCVFINDCPATIETRVRIGEVVRVVAASPPDKLADAENLPVDIVYEDTWIIVVNKPAGQIAHPAGAFAFGSLESVLQAYLDKRSRQKGMVRPGIVHRLDRQTSGLMVVPKDHVGHRELTLQFTKRTVKKKYIAIVEGSIPDDTGWIHFPIGEVPNPECSLVCSKSFALKSKVATTFYRVLERFANHTLVEANPTTGRHHQIRVHFAELGFPLVADEFYMRFGFIKDGTPLRDPAKMTAAELAEEVHLVEPFYDTKLPLRRHALHASALAFKHPISKQQLSFQAPLPRDFEDTLTVLRQSPIISD
jgi:23S rRNA pseudouridine1911/1915/1917 synthase